MNNRIVCGTAWIMLYAAFALVIFQTNDAPKNYPAILLALLLGGASTLFFHIGGYRCSKAGWQFWRRG